MSSVENPGQHSERSKTSDGVLRRRVSSVAVIGVVGGAALLGTIRGGFLPKQPPDQATIASVPSPVDPTVVPVVDFLETVYAQTPFPAGVQMVQDLGEIPPGPVDRLDVAYFHHTHRCSGCLWAEEMTRRTLDTHYADRLQDGSIRLVVEDVDNPADPELARMYGAGWSSLYLGVMKNDFIYIYPVEDIWFVLGDEAKFTAVVRDAIDAVFGGA